VSLFHRRSRREDPYLEWKVRLFSVAAVAGILGIYLEERWMVGVAIVILAVAMALGLLGGRGQPSSHDDDEDREDEVEEGEARDGSSPDPR